MYSVLTYQIKFRPPPLDYYIFRNFVNPWFIQPSPLPWFIKLLSFETFSNPLSPAYSNSLSIWHSRVIKQVPNQASTQMAESAESVGFNILQSIACILVACCSNFAQTVYKMQKLLFYDLIHAQIDLIPFCKNK